MPPPRLIFVNRVYRPSEEATAQLLTDLAEGLAGRGHEIHVIAAGDVSGPDHGVIVHRTGPGERHGGMVSRAGNYLAFLRTARGLLHRLVRPGDIVVLMTDPPLLAAAATGPARRNGGRVVQWIQDIYPEIVPQHYGAWAGLPLALFRWRRNRTWRASVLCLPVGEDMARLVAAQGVAGDRVVVSANWAPRELDQVPVAEEIAAYRTAKEIPSGFVVGYSGNLGRVHEFATVLAAITELHAASPAACTFRFTASGPRLAALQTTQSERQLSNLRLLPPAPRRELALNLAAADAHLVTLRPGFESLVNPSKVAGILAAGRPILFVGPLDSALADFIRREQVGVVIAPGDAAALVRTIRDWAAGPDSAVAQLGRNARAVYERRYSHRVALTHWENLLKEPVLSAPSKPTIAMAAANPSSHR